MRKKLLKLAPERLAEIARQFSITGKDQGENARLLAEYLSAYALTYADLASRFNLPK